MIKELRQFREDLALLKEMEHEQQIIHYFNGYLTKHIPQASDWKLRIVEESKEGVELMLTGSFVFEAVAFHFLIREDVFEHGEEPVNFFRISIQKINGEAVKEESKVEYLLSSLVGKGFQRQLTKMAHLSSHQSEQAQRQRMVNQEVREMLERIKQKEPEITFVEHHTHFKLILPLFAVELKVFVQKEKTIAKINEVFPSTAPSISILKVFYQEEIEHLTEVETVVSSLIHQQEQLKNLENQVKGVRIQHQVVTLKHQGEWQLLLSNTGKMYMTDPTIVQKIRSIYSDSHLSLALSFEMIHYTFEPSTASITFSHLGNFYTGTVQGDQQETLKALAYDWQQAFR